ncbi:hypothetical protein [Streptomyces sp. SID2888]|uniref:hypothetical protein n=1 Tax=Streptomyces sp. SID2888 TaxID=2690256 RepID=UPI00136B701D|nr:hypothetical protein [Streptomyces sp. SID2888]MYV48589.1 hypothetical protein [Streptomyces sp. SID2888]
MSTSNMDARQAGRRKATRPYLDIRIGDTHLTVRNRRVARALVFLALAGFATIGFKVPWPL